MSDPVFIARATVEMIHRRSLEQHGGQDGVRDDHALESALAQPVNVHLYGQGDLCDLAAAYAFHLAQDQPFIDGNKRTAIATALMFLEANSLPARRLTDENLYDAMIAIAERRLDKVAFAAIFRAALMRK